MTTTLLTDADIADRLGLSVDHVRRRSRAGDFPHVRIGRAYRYTEADFEAIVTAHRRQPVVEEVKAENVWGVRTRGRKAS